MDNHRNYNAPSDSRPRWNFQPEVQPPSRDIPCNPPQYHGPPPNFPPPSQYHGPPPQYHGPPPNHPPPPSNPPPPTNLPPPSPNLPPQHPSVGPFPPSAFQNNVRGPAPIPNQSTTSSSSSFQSNRHPFPEFNQPPPPFHGYGGHAYRILPEATPHRSSSVPGQDYASVVSSWEFRPSQNAGRPSDPRTAKDTCSQQMFDSPDDYGTCQESCGQSSSRIAFTSLGATEADEEASWMENFEQKVLKRERMEADAPVTKESKKSLKLMDVQHMVSQSKVLMDKLLHLKEKMRGLGKQDRQFLEFVNQAEKLKLELDNILEKFRDPHFAEDVHRLISQRRKKRERTKKQHKLKLKQEKEREKLWKKKEETIDAWRENLRQKEEEARREAAFKAETDSILGEVRQKQVDVVKMQQLLEGLISLRIARLNKGAAHGFITTPQDDQLFNITMKKISDIVNAQMEDYKLEEQTLRVMMEESTSYQRTISGKEKNLLRLETSMKKFLFGERAPLDQQVHDEYTAADRCLETLIQRRHEWDQFACEGDNPLASSIPLGWVIPPGNPTDDWNELRN